MQITIAAAVAVRDIHSRSLRRGRRPQGINEACRGRDRRRSERGRLRLHRAQSPDAVSADIPAVTSGGVRKHRPMTANPHNLVLKPAAQGLIEVTDAPCDLFDPRAGQGPAERSATCRRIVCAKTPMPPKPRPPTPQQHANVFGSPTMTATRKHSRRTSRAL